MGGRSSKPVRTSLVLDLSDKSKHTKEPNVLYAFKSNYEGKKTLKIGIHSGNFTNFYTRYRTSYGDIHTRVELFLFVDYARDIETHFKKAWKDRRGEFLSGNLSEHYSATRKEVVAEITKWCRDNDKEITEGQLLRPTITKKDKDGYVVVVKSEDSS